MVELVVPADADPPLPAVPVFLAASTVVGGVSTFAPGLYCTAEVMALEPAEGDAEAANEAAAAAPLTPLEALDWMYSLFSVAGSALNRG